MDEEYIDIDDVEEIEPEKPPGGIGFLLWLIALTALLIAGLTAFGFIVRERDNARMHSRVLGETYIQLLPVWQGWKGNNAALYATEDGSVPKDDSVRFPDGTTLRRLPFHAAFRELAEKSGQNGAPAFRLTALQPKNISHAPDDFERRALEKMAASAAAPRPEWRESERSIRVLIPLSAESRCLSCHGIQTKGVGKLLGGISVTVPRPEIGAERRNVLLAGAALLIVMLGLILGGLRLIAKRHRDLLEALEEAEEGGISPERLEELSRLDPLTGAYTRTAFLDLLDRELARARRHSLPISVAVIEADHLKTINDRYGRKMGDAVLQHIALVLKAEVRGYDVVGRTSGIKFTLVLAQAELQGAVEKLERLREMIGNTPIELGKTRTPATISAGLAQLRNVKESTDSLLSRADAALANAKANGRNRIEADDMFRIRP